jgi:hypothetical protein
MIHILHTAVIDSHKHISLPTIINVHVYKLIFTELKMYPASNFQMREEILGNYIRIMTVVMGTYLMFKPREHPPLTITYLVCFLDSSQNSSY